MDESEGVAVEIKDSQYMLALRGHRQVASEMEVLLGWKVIEVRVEATIPGFTARFFQEVNLWKLREFYDGLVRIGRDLKGNAYFKDYEDAINLHVQIDELGHLEWKVELSHPVDYESATLRFKIENDQSYLPAILQQFESFFERFQ